MSRSVGLIILLLSVELVLPADTGKYKELGGQAVLSPGSVPGTITSITWKHGADIAVEWYGGETVAYREFKDRCKLDFSSGALTISNLILKSSGLYTAEINNKVMSPTEITVISAVPKPTVSKSCNSEETQCTLTCKANITDAGPVEYSWMVDDKKIVGSSDNLEIGKDDPEKIGKPINCQLKNPVSSERSDDVIIPITNSNLVAIIVGVIAGLLVILIVAALLIYFFICRRSGTLNFTGEMAQSSYSLHESGPAQTPAELRAPSNEPEKESLLPKDTNGTEMAQSSYSLHESGPAQTPAELRAPSNEPEKESLLPKDTNGTEKESLLPKDTNGTDTSEEGSPGLKEHPED
ncbi:V-set and immunoglobulin domain-containing protein 1-like isoform X2 [Pelmatolapia mariae]|uniref:V-set and immunoglobulin domain-containing protein 1-like isoform X2 n=1 Tax=Pelmatolapia mariae TaxID=158779 RepID=UPI002FE61EAB